MAAATAGIPRVILSIYAAGLILLAAATAGLAAQTGGDDWQSKLPASVGWLLLLTLVGVLCSPAVAKLVRGYARLPVSVGGSASNPGGFRLSHSKLKRFHPELYGLRGICHNLFLNTQVLPVQHFRNLVAEHLMLGDSRAAIVMSTNPLLVAAYSDDLDCAVLLEFGRSLVRDYGLRAGSHLLTVNTYLSSGAAGSPPDIVRGPQARAPWVDFRPLIADFLVDDCEQLAQRKNGISQAEWARAYACGAECLKRSGFTPRSGAPLADFG